VDIDVSDRTVELRRCAVEQFVELLELADSIPPDMRFALEARDKNPRDILGHIAAWHQMLLRWHARALEGVPTPVPSVSHTWDEVAELNQTIWRVIQELTYSAARAAAARTHVKLLAALDETTEVQLWTPGLFGWTRNGTVGSWFKTLTASHYDWGIAKMRRALRVAAVDDHGPPAEVPAQQAGRTWE
jgi:hypothetical protein